MTRDQWIASAEALLHLDAKGALVPHGLGGHARTLLEEALKHIGEKKDEDARPAG